jgi:hypothetical protein
MKKVFAHFFLGCFFIISCGPKEKYSYTPYSQIDEEKQAFLEDLKKRNFDYFWNTMDSSTYQIPDRYPERTFTSIAATGFGLTAYIIGVNNAYITREAGARRVLNTLEWIWQSPQNQEKKGASGYRGFYYHFLTFGNGDRFKEVELSTIDTGLLMAGILACQSFFTGKDTVEQRIRALSDSLYLRIEWDWAMDKDNSMSMGWSPEKGFIQSKWTGYNEAMILLIMALGSPSHPIDGSAWKTWTETYSWDSFYGFEHINFGPLFGHQYSHMFIDFRGIFDDYMEAKGIDYFENSRRATLSNRAYCIDNPKRFAGYGTNLWGLTACDGPQNTTKFFNSDSVSFYSYRARGASELHIVDDGTIAPTAAGGSIPFAPVECIDALFYIKNKYGKKVFQEYGFIDAFNLSFENKGIYGWYDTMYLGIDQGPFVIQIENYQNELIWDIMKHNKYIVNGLRRAGFKGGWLDEI